MASPWDLLKAGQTEAGIEMLREFYRRDSWHSNAFSLAHAYLFATQYAAAVELVDGILSKHPKQMAGHYATRGVLHWVLSNRPHAILCWKDGLDCAYADFAGGISVPLLLFFASVREPTLCEMGLVHKILKKRLKRVVAMHWPGPLGRYVIGEITEAEIRQVAAEQVKPRNPQYRAEVDFYTGVLRLQAGDRQGYFEFLRKCRDAVQECAIIPDEFYLARYELEQAERGS